MAPRSNPTTFTSTGPLLGASLAPYAAERLLAAVGLGAVGLYITGAALLSVVALLLLRERAGTAARIARQA